MQIRDARKQAGMTQVELAEKIGVNRATLSKYENGQIEPSISQLDNIAEALDIPLFELLPKEYRPVLDVGWFSGYEDRSDEFREETNFGCDELDRRKTDTEYFRLLLAYEKLNHDGRQRVTEYAEALASTGNYEPSEPPRPLVTKGNDGWVMYIDVKTGKATTPPEGE